MFFFDPAITNKLTTIFWWYSEAYEQNWSIHWILLDVFFYIQLSFSIFFMDSKVNCQIHMITDMFKNIWKEYFIKECFWSVRNILRVRFYRLAVTGVRSSRLNVIYTKFRRAIMAQLNKIWRVWACGRAIACHSRPGLYVCSIYVLCLRGRGTYLAKHCLFDRSCQSLKLPQKLLEINAKKI